MRKKPTIKDCIKYVCDGLDTINDSIRKQNKDIAEQNEISKQKLQFDKETKDRVNISLKDYEQLKNELKDYKETAEHYKNIFNALKLDCYLDYLDPHSVIVETMKDPARMSTRVYIHFDCKTMVEFIHEHPTIKFREIEDYSQTIEKLKREK